MPSAASHTLNPHYLDASPEDERSRSALMIATDASSPSQERTAQGVRFGLEGGGSSGRTHTPSPSTPLNGHASALRAPLLRGPSAGRSPLHGNPANGGVGGSHSYATNALPPLTDAARDRARRAANSPSDTRDDTTPSLCNTAVFFNASPPMILSGDEHNSTAHSTNNIINEKYYNSTINTTGSADAPTSTLAALLPPRSGSSSPHHVPLTVDRAMFVCSSEGVATGVILGRNLGELWSVLAPLGPRLHQHASGAASVYRLIGRSASDYVRPIDSEEDYALVRPALASQQFILEAVPIVDSAPLPPPPAPMAAANISSTANSPVRTIPSSTPMYQRYADTGRHADAGEPSAPASNRRADLEGATAVNRLGADQPNVPARTDEPPVVVVTGAGGGSGGSGDASSRQGGFRFSPSSRLGEVSDRIRMKAALPPRADATAADAPMSRPAPTLALEYSVLDRSPSGSSNMAPSPSRADYNGLLSNINDAMRCGSSHGVGGDADAVDGVAAELSTAFPPPHHSERDEDVAARDDEGPPSLPFEKSEEEALKSEGADEDVASPPAVLDPMLRSDAAVPAAVAFAAKGRLQSFFGRGTSRDVYCLSEEDRRNDGVVPTAFSFDPLDPRDYSRVTPVHRDNDVSGAMSPSRHGMGPPSPASPLVNDTFVVGAHTAHAGSALDNYNPKGVPLYSISSVDTASGVRYYLSYDPIKDSFSARRASDMVLPASSTAAGASNAAGGTARARFVDASSAFIVEPFANKDLDVASSSIPMGSGMGPHSVSAGSPTMGSSQRGAGHGFAADRSNGATAAVNVAGSMGSSVIRSRIGAQFGSGAMSAYGSSPLMLANTTRVLSGGHFKTSMVGIPPVQHYYTIRNSKGYLCRSSKGLCFSVEPNAMSIVVLEAPISPL